MSSPPPTSTWTDRRALFQKGREVHPSDRRSSTSSNNPASPTSLLSDTAAAARRASVSSVNSVEKTLSAALPSSVSEETGDGAKGPPSPELASSPPASTAGRRRSSNKGVLFESLLTHKRGSEDYGQRRASHTEQYTSGIFGGWYGKTFRGAGGVTESKPAAAAAEQSDGGVVERVAGGGRRESVPVAWQDRRGLFQKGREQ